MSTLQITLSDELDRFVAAKVEDGTCADANAVIQTALRRMAQEEREDEEKMVALRKRSRMGSTAELPRAMCFSASARNTISRSARYAHESCPDLCSSGI